MSEITYFDCKYCHEGFRMDGVARCCEAALDVDALVAELNETRGCRGDPRDQSRIAQLEAALRGVLTLADISKPIDADALTAKVREAWQVLGSQSETPVNPTHQHREFCGALRGMPCICDATPLETEGK